MTDWCPAVVRSSWRSSARGRSLQGFDWLSRLGLHGRRGRRACRRADRRLRPSGGGRLLGPAGRGAAGAAAPRARRRSSSWARPTTSRRPSTCASPAVTSASRSRACTRRAGSTLLLQGTLDNYTAMRGARARSAPDRRALDAHRLRWTWSASRTSGSCRCARRRPIRTATGATRCSRSSGAISSMTRPRERRAARAAVRHGTQRVARRGVLAAGARPDRALVPARRRRR